MYSVMARRAAARVGQAWSSASRANSADVYLLGFRVNNVPCLLAWACPSRGRCGHRLPLQQERVLGALVPDLAIWIAVGWLGAGIVAMAGLLILKPRWLSEAAVIIGEGDTPEEGASWTPSSPTDSPDWVAILKIVVRVRGHGLNREPADRHWVHGSGRHMVSRTGFRPTESALTDDFLGLTVAVKQGPFPFQAERRGRPELGPDPERTDPDHQFRSGRHSLRVDFDHEVALPRQLAHHPGEL